MENISEPINNKQIIGILNRIREANKMIAAHQKEGEESIAKQYIRHREDFFEQLKNVLAELQIKAELQAMSV